MVHVPVLIILRALNQVSATARSAAGRPSSVHSARSITLLWCIGVPESFNKPSPSPTLSTATSPLWSYALTSAFLVPLPSPLIVSRSLVGLRGVPQSSLPSLYQGGVSTTHTAVLHHFNLISLFQFTAKCMTSKKTCKIGHA